MIRVIQHENPNADDVVQEVQAPALTAEQLRMNVHHVTSLHLHMGKLGLSPLTREANRELYNTWMAELRQSDNPFTAQELAELPALGTARAKLVQKPGELATLVSYSHVSEGVASRIDSGLRAYAYVYLPGSAYKPYDCYGTGFEYAMLDDGRVIMDGAMHMPAPQHYDQVEQVWNGLGLDGLVTIPAADENLSVRFERHELAPRAVEDMGKFLVGNLR
jgi:hypothetical protein